MVCLYDADIYVYVGEYNLNDGNGNGVGHNAVPVKLKTYDVLV